MGDEERWKLVEGNPYKRIHEEVSATAFRT